MMGKHGVAIVSMAISAVIAVWGVWRPEQMTGSALALTTFALQKLDWLFMGACTLFLVLSLFLAIGPYGKIKLGADDEEPEFDTVSWLSHDVRRRDGGRASCSGAWPSRSTISTSRRARSGAPPTRRAPRS